MSAKALLPDQNVSQVLRFLSVLQQTYGRFLEAQQVRMANNHEGLLLLALLGMVCGLLSGGIIIVFRLFIDGSAAQFMPLGSSESFEQLSQLERFSLCVFGGLLVGLLMQALKPKNRTVGVIHVIERLNYHQGYLPLKNAVVQFFTGAVALLSGQSVGREGPSIHLGATSGSVLARLLRVPNNSGRILVACGVAAAISAAFNTPLAGVIFAMEVVVMEYTVIGFAPVILSAVSAATLARLAFEDSPSMTVITTNINSINELPIVVVMGILIGCLSALFIYSTVLINRVFKPRSIVFKTTSAGFITGCLALYLPEIMGIGYDTVDKMLMAKIGIGTALLLTFAKIFATAAATGLGVPAGLIGPTLFIGAAAGGAIGMLAEMLIPNTADSGYYALLGMAAMMAATLQAPLAALTYLLELSADQSIILPGMAVVISASLIGNGVFKQSSIYAHVMQCNDLDYRNSELAKSLRRIGVASVMERNFISQNHLLSAAKANEILHQEPRWILLQNQNSAHQPCVLPATDLAVYLSNSASNNAHENEHEKPHSDGQDSKKNKEIDLNKIPAKRLDAGRVTILATLQEAYEQLHNQQCDVLIVTGAHGASKQRIMGLITREHIESSYRA